MSNERGDEELLASLRRKYAAQDTRNFGVMDFLGAFGSALDAHLYLRLFRPRFLAYRGMVFREEVAESEDDLQKIDVVLERHHGDRKETEKAFNLVEVPSDIFSSRIGETSISLDMRLVEALAESWSWTLANRFGGKNFVVEVLSSEETGGELGLTFFSK